MTHNLKIFKKLFFTARGSTSTSVLPRGRLSLVVRWLIVYEKQVMVPLPVQSAGWVRVDESSGRTFSASYRVILNFG